MIIVDKSAEFRSTEPIYDYDGSVKLYVGFTFPVATGELFKVVLSPYGYVAVPLVSAADRFYFGAANQPCYSGEGALIKVGGVADVLLGDEYREGRYLQFDGTGFAERDPEPLYALSGDHLYIRHRLRDGLYEVSLLHREVIL